jgi:hypothetical protein
MNTGVLNSNTSSWSFVVLKSNHFVLRDPSVVLDGSSALGLLAPGDMTDAAVMAVPELSLKLNSATWVMVLAVLVWSRVNLMNLIPTSALCVYLPAGQPVQSARRLEPVVLVYWPAGQSRQEVEPGAGWYLLTGQEVQGPASRYSPAGQPVQSARRAEPVPVVNWPAGQSRQEVEPAVGWYLEAGQDMHPAGAQSLKPAQLAPY